MPAGKLEKTGINAGEYARVGRVDVEHSALTVERSTDKRFTYDPRRLQGVSVYQAEEREFAPGDRIQFTAPVHEKRITNRQLGTIERIPGSGRMEVRMDSGRMVEFSVCERAHLDHSYAMTSCSAQSATVERVILHVDAGMSPEELVNSRLAYVGLSRGVNSMEVYTDKVDALVRNVSREASKSQALASAEKQALGVAV
jgi:ATP-dependent exoDNAse (exonuclease V) alpha subunit